MKPLYSSQRNAALTVPPPENPLAVTEPGSRESANANASGKSIVRNALAGYISTFVGMAVGFLLTPFLVRKLGADAFGTWTLLMSLMGYISLLEFGIGTASAKRVAECRATGDRQRLENVLGSALALFILFACLAFFVGVLIIIFALPRLSIPLNERHLAQWGMALLVLNQAASFLFLTRSIILYGAGRSDLMALPGTVITTITVILQCAVVYFHLSFVGLACVMLLSNLASYLVGQWIIRRQFPEIRASLRSATPAMIRELVTYGGRNGITTVFVVLGFSTDTVIIGALLPVSAVTSYAIASKLINFVRTIALKPVDVLLPAYAHFHAIGDRKRQFEIYIQSTVLCVCLSMPLCIVLCFFGDGVLRLWIGPGHRDSYPILIVMSLFIAITVSSATGFTMLTAKENIILIKISGGVAFINFGLSVLLTRLYGAVGPALGSLAVVGIPDFFIIPLFVCRELRYPYRTYLAEVWGTLLTPIAAAAIVAAALRWHFGAPAGLLLPVEIAATLITFYGIWARFGLRAEQRQAYAERIRGFMKKRTA